MKTDKQLSFKTDEHLAKRIAEATNQLDCNLSELVRACLIIGIPVVISNPVILDDILRPARCQCNHTAE